MNAVTGTIRDLEQRIIERLRSKISRLEVDAFPDDPAAYRLRHQLGALLVGYRGSDFGPPMDHDVDHGQIRTLSMDVMVLARALKGHEGAYAYLEAARAALVGFDAGVFEPLVAGRDVFLGHDDGVWTFALTVQTRAIYTAVPEDEVDEFIGEVLDG